MIHQTCFLASALVAVVAGSAIGSDALPQDEVCVNGEECPLFLLQLQEARMESRSFSSQKGGQIPDAVKDEKKVEEFLREQGAPEKAVEGDKDALLTWLTSKGYVPDRDFRAIQLKFGKPEDAAEGILARVGLNASDLPKGEEASCQAIAEEIRKNGDKDDNENYKYVSSCIACDLDCVPTAVKASWAGGSTKKEDFDFGHCGETLEAFLNTENSRIAGLQKQHIIALRFYTTSSHWRYNTPLRKGVKPHPWAHTVYYLAEGLKKLREVQATLDPGAFMRQTVLWRGMQNVTMNISAFEKVGGTELAPMSTSKSKGVAQKYAKANGIVFKYVTRGLSTGVSIQFLSVYPKEEEFLYPPGTLLNYVTDEREGDHWTVTIKPQIA